MKNFKLEDSLETYSKSELLGSEEEALIKRYQSLIVDDACYGRSAPGHITGSAFVLDPSKRFCLLTHHKKLGMWLQLGGHSENEANTLSVALREAVEESGINEIVPLMPEIFDLDIHEIPKNSKEERHLHYDVRFVLLAKKTVFQVSEESHNLRWVPLAEMLTLPTLERPAQKLIKFIAQLN